MNSFGIRQYMSREEWMSLSAEQKYYHQIEWLIYYISVNDALRINECINFIQALKDGRIA